MSTNNFKFNKIDQLTHWSDEVVGVILSHARQAVLDLNQDVVLVVIADSNKVLEVYDKKGLILEVESPDSLDFQYFLKDENGCILVICSERNVSGDVLDWYCKIDFENNKIIKEGRAY